MNIQTSDPLIEAILEDWRDRIGDAFAGYSGHVYRVFNFCLALHPCEKDSRQKIAIAACFHDIGLWSDHTVDYLPPSMAQARAYLTRSGQDGWSSEICRMIEMHHKIRPCTDEIFPLVEVFRQADLVDFSLGLARSGLDGGYVKAVRNAIPNQGFHRFLLGLAGQWFRAHPFQPPPFMKW